MYFISVSRKPIPVTGQVKAALHQKALALIWVTVILFWHGDYRSRREEVAYRSACSHCRVSRRGEERCPSLVGHLLKPLLRGRDSLSPCWVCRAGEVFCNKTNCADPGAGKKYNLLKKSQEKYKRNRTNPTQATVANKENKK